MALILRDATPEDEAFLFRLYSSTREQEISAWGWDPVQVDVFLRMQFRAQQASYGNMYPGSRHQIILSDGVPAGRMLVSCDPSEMRLVDISLLAEYRGKGIGAKLIRELMDEASGRRLPLRLQVSQSNVARRLYERLGFQMSDEDPMYVSMEWKATSSVELGNK